MYAILLPSTIPRLGTAGLIALALGFQAVPAQADPGERILRKPAILLEHIARGSDLPRKAPSAVEIIQSGIGHTAAVRQSGGNNHVRIRQHGSNHTANVTQTGGNNYMTIIQVGNGAHADVTQTGNERGFVLQWSK